MKQNRRCHSGCMQMLCCWLKQNNWSKWWTNLMVHVRGGFWKWMWKKDAYFFQMDRSQCNTRLYSEKQKVAHLMLHFQCFSHYYKGPITLRTFPNQIFTNVLYLYIYSLLVIINDNTEQKEQSKTSVFSQKMGHKYIIWVPVTDDSCFPFLS